MDYFKLKEDGIIWEVTEGQVHTDDIEMSGFMSDFIVKYGVDADKNLILSRFSAFPTFRVIPNDTYGTLRRTYDSINFPKILVNGAEQSEKAVSFYFDGILTVNSKSDKVCVCREFFPAVEKSATCEKVTVKNIFSQQIHLTLSTPECLNECDYKGCKGYYVMEVLHDSVDITLNPYEEFTYGVYSTVRLPYEPRLKLNIDEEKQGRLNQIKRITNGMSLQTDNQELDTMFKFSIIRAGESIFHTGSGDFHSPGGKNYYAAVWANDQLEYAAPWFSIIGDTVAVNASVNAFIAYKPFMTENYYPIPCSVISEGFDIWDGAGDRGDSSMFLYGAAYTALVRQDSEITAKLWPCIKWCAEYTKRKTSSEGVICSKTDELETRIPTDSYANLSTSCICYGGLRLAAKLAKQLGEDELSKEYTNRADNLEKSIEKYYGANIHGMETYRYSNGFNSLRAWICLPLCMGINNRRDDTLKALFSEYLWRGNGMLSCELGEDSKDENMWDRSALFAFKGAMIAERTDLVWQYFTQYVHRRLCGERVPYAVEAYPENNMRHLSGESALFARIIPEGMLKLMPETGRTFSVNPQLPSEMKKLRLNGISLADRKVDVFVGEDRTCEIYCDNKIIASGVCGGKILFEV